MRLSETIAQHSTLDVLQPLKYLKYLMDDSGAFETWVMSNYRGTSECEKIKHIFSMLSNGYQSYTSLLAQRSERVEITQANVLCTHTCGLELGHGPIGKTNAILQLKIVIRCQYNGPTPLWYTVSVQRDHHCEPRHAIDKADAVLIHIPATGPAGDTTSTVTHTLQWHYGGSNWKALYEPLHEGDRICVWAHTE